MPEVMRADLTRPEHAQALVELLNHYACDPMGGGKPLSGWVQNNLASELSKRDDALILLAFDNKKALGLLTAFEGFSTFHCRPLLNIHDIIVTPDYRGQGIAQQLLSEAEHIARQRDYCKLTLEVLAGNSVAQGAYRKFGFRGYELDPTMGQALFWEKRL